MRLESNAPERFAVLVVSALLLVGSSAMPAVAASTAVLRPACGGGALVAAIKQANTTPGTSTIVLRAGCTYTLTKGSSSAGEGPNGLPIVTTPITIHGNGATIARTANAPAFRFFEVRGPKAVLRLDALTLRGGRASAGAAGKPGGDGGAIYVYGGTLAISSVTFSGNRAGRGGDARAPAIHGGKGGSGGAIYVRYQAVALTITRSTFTGNVAGRGGNGVAGGNGGDGGVGGAIMIGGTRGMRVVGSTFTSNAAGDRGSGRSRGEGGGSGGAIETFTATWVTGSLFASNHAGRADGPVTDVGLGGAIDAWAQLTVADSTFTANRALEGGAIKAVHLEAGLTAVVGSTFSENAAASQGGAILLTGGTLDVTNSTFTANHAASGAAIHLYDGTGHLTGSTVAGNVDSDMGAILSDLGTTTLRNMLITGNAAAHDGNCASYTGNAFLDGGGNLTFGDRGCPGTVSSGDPGLLPLADNGGPTQTMALGLGSAAIDAGDDTICAAPVGAPGYGGGGKDQRGVARPKGAHCDAGASEYVALDHLVLTPDPATIEAGGSQAYTVEGRSAAGEDLGDVTSATTFSIAPDGTCTARTCAASVPGDHTVTGTDGAATGTALLRVKKLNQTIAFGRPADQTLAQSPLTLTASASSGGMVTFSTTTPAVCTSGGPNGATITLLRPGTCTVEARQAGDAFYNPAPTVTRSFGVT